MEYEQLYLRISLFILMKTIQFLFLFVLVQNTIISIFFKKKKMGPAHFILFTILMRELTLPQEKERIRANYHPVLSVLWMLI